MSAFQKLDEFTLQEVGTFAEFLAVSPSNNEAGAIKWVLSAEKFQDLSQWHATFRSVSYEDALDDPLGLTRGDIVGRGEFAVRVDQPIVFPSYGVVASANGWVGALTMAEANYVDPELKAIIGNRTIDDLAQAAPTVKGAVAVTMPWGASSNYGHFMFDALPAIVLFLPLAKAGLLKFVFPPLKNWHADILSLLGIGSDERIEVEGFARFDRAYYFSYLDHYLHWPGLGARIARDFLRAQLRTLNLSPSTERVFLTRRGQHKRALINAKEVEHLFSRNGFSVFAPEAVLPRHQLAMLANAPLVAGISGAAWGNYFAGAENSAAFEIMPHTFPSAWIRNFCGFRNSRWHGYVTKPEATIRSPNEISRGAYLPNSDFKVDLKCAKRELDRWIAAIDRER